MFISGHSIPHISLGGFILIFGFMAFNAGSQGTMSQKGDGEAIAAACLSTLVSIKSKSKSNYSSLFVYFGKYQKGPFNNYVDKMRGGGSQKMSNFVHAQGI